MIDIRNKKFFSFKSELSNLMFKESYSDLKIIDGNNSSYFCHKVILRSLIPDEVLSDVTCINLPWAFRSTVKSLLELAYNGVTKIDLNQGDIESFIKLAQSLSFQDKLSYLPEKHEIKSEDPETTENTKLNNIKKETSPTQEISEDENFESLENDAPFEINVKQNLESLKCEPDTDLFDDSKMEFKEV